MDINPISFLKEYFEKLRIDPKYELIHQKTGTHLNEFTIKLDCGNGWPPVIQTGASKKEAKQKVAAIMRDKILSHSNNNYSPTSMPVGYTFERAENWIGKLHECVAGKGQILPKFDFGRTGPAHKPKFTATCSYKNFKEEATASTKKEAKNLVAKLMYEKLSDNISQIQVLSKPLKEVEVDKEDKKLESNPNVENYMQSLLSEMNDKEMHNAASKAKYLYTELTQRNVNRERTAPVSSNDNIDFSKYYLYLKNYINYKSKSSINPAKRLSEILAHCRKHIETCDFNSEKPIQLLRKFSFDLKIKLSEELSFLNFSKTTGERKNVYKCILTLDSKPRVVECGLSENKKEAELAAVMNIALTLLIVLN